MANVVVVLDPDADRRERFLGAVRGRISPFPELAISQRKGDGWCAALAAPGSTPFDERVDDTGAAFVWGEAADADGKRLHAGDVREAWRGNGLPTWDGFHLALEVSGSGHLTASVDILGYLPLYHWQGNGVSLVGTSVDLFRAHPAFQTRLDVAGLVGILLMNSIVGSRTLFEGVRRLGVRHQLRIRDGKASEVEYFRLPAPDPSFLGLPLEGHVEIMGAALDRSFARLAGPRNKPQGMLLSGGLDSRQIGGFLQDQGIQPHALTFGLPSDIEMRCARSVARELGLEHQTVEMPAADYPVAARNLVVAEGLATGFANVIDWAMASHLDRVPDRVWVGHSFDGVIGGIHMHWAYDAGQKRYSIDTLLDRLHHWAFTPRQLKDVLDPDCHSVIDDVMVEVKDSWESCGDRQNVRTWHYDLLMRQRYNVGAALWPMTFRSWPVSPVFDQEVLRTAVSIPASSMHARRMQKMLLIARKPGLAAIPLDRNSYDSLSLLPTLADRARAKIVGKWHRTMDRMPRAPWNRDSLFYYRTYGFDSPGWSAIRREYDSDRRFVPSIVRRDAVDKFLPAAGHRLDTKDAIIDSSRAKMLLGLGMAGRHFGLG